MNRNLVAEVKKPFIRGVGSAITLQALCEFSAESPFRSPSKFFGTEICAYPLVLET